MPYLLREGTGKAVALYTRCEDELLAKAELLVLMETLSAKFVGKPIIGFLDVDPTFTIQEFKKGYRNDYTRFRLLMDKRAEILKNGWNYPEMDLEKHGNRNVSGGEDDALL